MEAYQAPGRREAVIICPGFFQSHTTPTFRRLSQALAEHYDVLAMDFRGHGLSSGLYTFSANEAEDLAAVLALARPQYTAIHLLGFSLGGAIAINTARQHPEGIHSLVAVSAPCVFEEIEFKWWTADAMRTGVQGLEAGVGCRPGNVLIKKERPLDHVHELAPLPLLFLHGTRDVIVGIEHSRRLHAAAQPPKHLAVISGGGHAEALFRDDPQGFLRLVLGWFRGEAAASR